MIVMIMVIKSVISQARTLNFIIQKNTRGSRRPPEDLPETSWRSPGDLPEIFRRSPGDLPEISRSKKKNLPEPKKNLPEMAFDGKYDEKR